MSNKKKSIDRREAAKKIGKYAALSVGTFAILNPKIAQAFSHSCNGENGNGHQGTHPIKGMWD